jgi:hypothetical protein
MTERLLQYIWQFQYFNTNSLTTIEDETIEVIYPGLFNHNQGPDFLGAKIKLGDTTWAGSVELHINSSDWINHQHTADANYNNVILHVVWQNDMDLGLAFSTLILEDKVSNLLLSKYEELMHAAVFIPCERNISTISDLVQVTLKERLVVERLQARSETVFSYLAKTRNHWEETFWWMIAKNFGIIVNSEAFEAVAQSLPLVILAKHKNQIHQLEALLLGQAGLLEKTFSEEYPKMLQKEYRFLKDKYELSKIHHPMMFLLMRPSNFPTVRLAQLAMLVHKSEHLFSKARSAGSVKELKAMLGLTANDYWHYHYVFDERSTFKMKKLGQEMIANILINTIIPVVFAYGHYHNESQYKNKALQWLDEIRSESNMVTRGFQQVGIRSKTAFDSQALIQLRNEYCSKKRCLDCNIGNTLLKDHYAQ